MTGCIAQQVLDFHLQLAARLDFDAPDGLTIRQLVRCLKRSWVESLPVDTEVVILDIDATDDETHGAQQLSFFHGFYDHHIYHPLMVYDG